MVDRIEESAEGLYVGNGSVWHKLPFQKIVINEKQSYTINEFAADGRVGFALDENSFSIAFTNIFVSGTNTSTNSADKLVSNLRDEMVSWMKTNTLQIKVYFSVISDYIELRGVGETTLYVFFKNMQKEFPNGKVNKVWIRKITFDLSQTP